MEEPVTVAATKQLGVSDTKIELERQFTLFAVLWAIASMLVAWDRIDPALADPICGAIVASMAVLAFAVLIRPAWTVPFVLLCLTHVVYGLAELPLLLTTELMWMFFGAAVCSSFLIGWVVNRSYSMGAVGLYRSFAPCLRMMFVLSILAIGIARLNWRFLDLENSPVTHTLAQFRGGAMPAEWVTYLTMSMLLVIDLFLAAALLVPSLRRFAVGFGSCYFAWQALIGFAEMRSMLPLLIAGLCLFISSAVVGRMYAAIQRWIPVAAIRSSGVAFVTALVVIIAGAIWFQERNATEPPTITARHIVMWATGAFVIIWSFTLLTSLIDQRLKLTWVSLLPRNPLHYLLIAAMICAGISPYVGLGSRGRFMEYSGLSTAGGANNHLLIPQTYLVGYERDLIQIIDSNDEYLQELANQELSITWFDLVNHVQPRPETSITFVRGDALFKVKRSGNQPELSTKNPWIVRKLLAFRLVDGVTSNKILSGKLTAQH